MDKFKFIFRISGRLSVGIAFLISMMIIISGIGLFYLSALNQRVEEMYYEDLVPIEDLDNIKSALYSIRGDVVEHILADDPEEKLDHEKLIRENEKIIQNLLSSFQSDRSMGEKGELLIQFDKHLSQYLAILEEDVLPLSGSGDPVSVTEAERIALGAALSSFHQAQNSMTDLMNYSVTRAEEHIKHSEADYQSAKWKLIIFGGLMVLVGCTEGFLTARSIINPIKSITDAMYKLSQGEMDTPVPALTRKDEVGEMAKALELFKNSLIQMDKMRAEQADLEKKSADQLQKSADEREANRLREEERATKEKLEAERRAEKIEHLLAGFNAKVTKVIQLVDDAANEMEETAQSMAEVAQSASSKTETSVSGADQATSNVQVMAAAAEELSASVFDISQRVKESSIAATDAVAQSEEASKTIGKLENAAKKIGEVVELIDDIASQTNLLALNATIEAARAGESGKGFAVVAGEVKSLANQTANATEEITKQISGIQTITEESVEVIECINQKIHEMSEISSNISTSVEEQSVATNEVSQGANQAAAGTDEILQNLSGVQVAIRDTGAAASQVLAASKSLSTYTVDLKTDIETFFAEIKAI